MKVSRRPALLDVNQHSTKRRPFPAKGKGDAPQVNDAIIHDARPACNS